MKLNVEIFENIDNAKRKILNIRKKEQFKHCNFYISKLNMQYLEEEKKLTNKNIEIAIKHSLNNILSRELVYKIEKKNENLIITTNNKSKKWNNLYEIKFEFGPFVIILKLKHWQTLKNVSLEKYKKSFRYAIYSYFMEMSKKM